MKRRPLVALLAVVGVSVLLLVGLLYLTLGLTPDLTGLSRMRAPEPPAALPARAAPTAPLTAVPSPTRAIREWQWVKPGFSGRDAITLTQGIEQYVYYRWSPYCDAPARRQIPMIWGRTTFYTDHVALKNLFNGPCNDGRPLLFLNEPAKAEQANISPSEAASMFYTMTRAASWPYERWHGPIYAGNNLVEERQWDAEFVHQFAERYNSGSTAIPEIAGWGIHVYGNYEYGPKRGDPNVVWTDDIPAAAIPAVVNRSMDQVDKYLAERKAEGNATLLAATEFGLLQVSQWHTPRTFYYTTTASFMDEYVRRFDLRPEIKAWFWFMSQGEKDEFLDTDLAVDGAGALTPNGVKWRELARARQSEN